jgi:hypothetical protein
VDRLAERAEGSGGRSLGEWRPDRLDLLVALGLGLAAFALYHATFQRVTYGDGPFLVKNFYCIRHDSAYWAGVSAPGVVFRPGYWYHPLYMLIAGSLWRALEWGSALDVLHLLSSASGALGIAATFLLSRAWGPTRVAGGLAAALLAASPGYWFFSTTIEIHALHAACVALCVVVTLWAPWGRPTAACLVVAAVLPLVFLSHRSGLLLGPGFVLLAQLARRLRTGRGFGRGGLLLFVGPLFLLAFAAAIAWNARMEGRTLLEFLSSSRRTVDAFERGPSLDTVYEGWLRPLGAIVPLALLAVALRRVRGLGLATVAVFLLPSMAYFVAWGLAERGGYALGTAGLVAAVAATALPRRTGAALAVGLPLLALSGYLGWSTLSSWQSSERIERLDLRARAVSSVLPRPGTLLSLNPFYEYVDAAVDDVIEVSFYGPLQATLKRGGTPEDFVERVAPMLAVQLERPDSTVLLDLGFRAVFEERAPSYLPYLDAFDGWLAEHARVVPLDSPGWPLARLE